MRFLARSVTESFKLKKNDQYSRMPLKTIGLGESFFEWCFGRLEANYFVGAESFKSIPRIDYDFALLDDLGVVEASVVGNNDDAVGGGNGGEHVLTQQNGVIQIDALNKGIGVGDFGAQPFQQHHDVESGRLAYVVDVPLVGNAEDMKFLSLGRICRNH